MNDYFSILIDFHVLTSHLLQANTEQEFDS